MTTWVSGDRVQRQCHTEGCSKTIHRGAITGLSHEEAVEMNLASGPRSRGAGPHAGVLWDDRPGVVEFWPLAELEREVEPERMEYEPGQPNAAVLKLAFWEAMNRSDDDERVHAMDAPCFHRGAEDGGDQLIDGHLPDCLWEHMAVAISELRAAAGLGKPQ